MKDIHFNEVTTYPKISQWFISLEGEGENIGEPSLYLRIAGCYSAACSFCDTKFSWGEAPNNKNIKDLHFLEEINNAIFSRKINRLTITGGEPLHYVSNFSDMVHTIQKYTDVHLTSVGFESNGNMLSNKHIVVELLKQFNEIRKKSGCLPSITISPKLNSDSCYENQIPQQDINEMYEKVFDNLSKYLIPAYTVNFKFVYGIDEEHDSLVIQNISHLLDIGIKPKNIFLMPFTPENPLTEDKDIWEKSKKATAQMALKIGIRYSPRIHVDNELD